MTASTGCTKACRSTPPSWAIATSIPRIIWCSIDSVDRNDLERALDTYEAWAKRVLEAEIPETLQGYVFYDLACFYATHGWVEKASKPLQQAFTLYPHTREWALTDPDLVELRPHQPE